MAANQNGSQSAYMEYNIIQLCLYTTYYVFIIQAVYYFVFQMQFSSD